MAPSLTDWISACCSIISVLIASSALFFVIHQIKQMNYQLLNMNNTFRNSILMTVLELENELIRRKVTWDDANFKLREYSIKLDIFNDTANEDTIELLDDKCKTSLENYLNSLDRFCYCILRDYISDRDWKTEYRDVVFDIVDNNNNNSFGVNSRFRNVIKIFQKWKDE